VVEPHSAFPDGGLRPDASLLQIYGGGEGKPGEDAANRATAWMRVLTPSRRHASARCSSTVRGERPRLAAMRAEVRPREASVRHWRCRPVRASTEEGGDEGWRMDAAQPGRKAAASPQLRG